MIYFNFMYKQETPHTVLVGSSVVFSRTGSFKQCIKIMGAKREEIAFMYRETANAQVQQSARSIAVYLFRDYQQKQTMETWVEIEKQNQPILVVFQLSIFHPLRGEAEGYGIWI